MVQVRYQRSTHSTHTGSTPFLASPSRVCLYFRSSGWSITARVHQCTGEDRDAGPAVVYGCHVTLSPQNVCIQVVQVGTLVREEYGTQRPLDVFRHEPAESP